MNELIKSVLVCCLSLAPATTSASEIQIDPSLQSDASVYEVDGRNGWRVNQKIRFGRFHTSKIDRGWTKGYDLPFLVRFSGAKEKLAFSMEDGEGRQLDAFCVGRLKEKDLRLFHEYFNVSAKDAFSGSLVMANGKSFDFYVANLNQNNWFREARGRITGEGLEIAIEPIGRLENGRRTLAMQVPGFSFVRAGETVGAVNLLNKGKVWLKNQLLEDEQIVLASVAAALLVRNDLSEANDNLD